MDAFFFKVIFNPSSPVITSSYREGCVKGLLTALSFGCRLGITRAPLGTIATGVGALLVFGG